MMTVSRPAGRVFHRIVQKVPQRSAESLAVDSKWGQAVIRTELKAMATGGELFPKLMRDRRDKIGLQPGDGQLA